MRYTHASYFAIAALLTLGGCSRFRSSDTTDSASSVVAAKTINTDTAMTVTETGYGQLRVGMTVANAATALGSPVPSNSGLDSACTYVHLANSPAGMRIMINGGTVARIDVDSSTIATGLGARVGDSEARIRELYGPRLTVEPHKYLPNGHYLIVTPFPPTDSNFRLVFETDGSRVTTYRAGRLPEVTWAEGCA
jgi:hypothetical protein